MVVQCCLFTLVREGHALIGEGLDMALCQRGNLMRKVLGTLIAFAAMPVAAGYAADMNMPLKAPPMIQTVYNWTGFYIGGEVGGGWSRETTTVSSLPAAGFPVGTVLNPANLSGVLGGGYAGYNYQINQFVLGIDGNYDGAGLTGSSTDISPTGNVLTHNEKMKWDAAITGRLGYAANNWLLFVKGGYAWAGFSDSTTIVGPAAGTASSSDTRGGGTVGAGVEYGFAQHWSAKVEYDYVKFQTSSYNITTSAGATPTRSTTSSLNELKGGIAYRF
jgi:outer membrane immunogenic protein